MGEDGTVVDLETQDYGDLGLWKPNRDTNLIPQGINFTESDSLAVGGTVVLNDVRAGVEAFLELVDARAASLALSATESAVIRATADTTASSSGGSTFTGQGQSLAVNAIIATNRVLSSARAYAMSSTIAALAGDVDVAASNVAFIDATALSAVSTGSQAVGILLAFNSVGWQPANLFFAAFDAIVGDPLLQERAFQGEQPAETWAFLSDTPVVAAGAVRVSATNEATDRLATRATTRHRRRPPSSAPAAGAATACWRRTSCRARRGRSSSSRRPRSPPRRSPPRASTSTPPTSPRSTRRPS